MHGNFHIISNPSLCHGLDDLLNLKGAGQYIMGIIYWPTQNHGDKLEFYIDKLSYKLSFGLSKTILES